jgi:hypothetical protein
LANYNRLPHRDKPSRAGRVTSFGPVRGPPLRGCGRRHIQQHRDPGGVRRPFYWSIYLLDLGVVVPFTIVGAVALLRGRHWVAGRCMR